MNTKQKHEGQFSDIFKIFSMEKLLRIETWRRHILRICTAKCQKIVFWILPGVDIMQIFLAGLKTKKNHQLIYIPLL